MGGESDDIERVTRGLQAQDDLFHRMPIALYRTSPEGEFLAANSALAELLGYASVEEMKARLGDAASAYVASTERSRWISEVTTAGVVRGFDVEMKRQDGTTIWVQDTARAIRDKDGAVIYFEGALIDITEKVEAQRAKDEFIATVSHELRNPIAVMLGMGEELASNYESFTDRDRREMAELIARQAEDASWLIEDMLVAYREDVGRIRVSTQEIDLTSEVERVLEVVDRPILLEIQSEKTSVKADPRRIRQILRNLVSNADRYGGEEIRIRLREQGDRVELLVCDSGEEIPQSEVGRIFEAFETGTGPNHHGSVGLGLFVGRKLARLMGGNLDYRYEDGYSCFVLSLPPA